MYYTLPCQQQSVARMKASLFELVLVWCPHWNSSRCSHLWLRNLKERLVSIKGSGSSFNLKNDTYCKVTNVLVMQKMNEGVSVTSVGREKQRFGCNKRELQPLKITWVKVTYPGQRHLRFSGFSLLPPQSPRSFTTLAHLGLFARPRKTAMT